MHLGILSNFFFQEDPFKAQIEIYVCIVRGIIFNIKMNKIAK